MENLCLSGDQAIADGIPTSSCSRPRVNPECAPILVLPIAGSSSSTSFAKHRTRVGLVPHSATARGPCHFSLLIGYGCRLAIQSVSRLRDVDDMIRQGCSRALTTVGVQTFISKPAIEKAS